MFTQLLIIGAVQSFPEIQLCIVYKSTTAGCRHFYVAFFLYELTETWAAGYDLSTRLRYRGGYRE